jgi:hypothetical protein
MNTRFTLLALAVMALAVAPVIAQDPPSATLTLEGTVVSSSPTSLAIQATDGTQKTFTVDDRSTVPANLARGSRVTVTYETSGSQMRAVSVTPADTESPSTTSGTGTETTPAGQLPATASPLPLVALLSAAAVGAGLLLRRRLA